MVRFARLLFYWTCDGLVNCKNATPVKESTVTIAIKEAVINVITVPLINSEAFEKEISGRNLVQKSSISATVMAGIKIFLQSKINISKIKRITGLHAINENTAFNTTNSDVNIGVMAKKKSDAMLTKSPLRRKHPSQFVQVLVRE